jgi:hypothetical protein
MNNEAKKIQDGEKKNAVEGAMAPMPVSECEDQKAAKRFFKKGEDMKSALAELRDLEASGNQTPEEWIEALDKAERAVNGFTSAVGKLDPQSEKPQRKGTVQE